MDQEVHYKGIRQAFDKSLLSSIEPILEGMPGGLFVYYADGDEELLYLNSAVLRIFGCDTEEEFRRLTGYTFRGMVHPDDLDEVERSIQSQIADSVYDFDYVEYRIIQKDGTVRWIEDYGHFMHTETFGDIFYVFIDDSTERLKKRMSELETVNEELRALYARESQYRKAILYDAVSFFEVNLTKDKFLSAHMQLPGGQFKDFFESAGIPRFENYSDYVRFQKNEMDSGEAYAEFADAKRLIQCCSRGELEQTYDGWMTDSTGGRHLHHYIFLLGKNEYTGDVVTMAVTKDMTDQVQRQNLLKSALNRAQSANIARNVFLQNMSHDIRTPLNVIIGYTDLAVKHKSDGAKIDNYLSQIRAAGEQLLAIVDESLEVVCMESGKVNPVEKLVELDDLLAELECAIRPQLEVKALRFTVDRSRVRNSVIYMDFLWMKEILLLLLDNAVKYTEPNGSVTLTVEEEELSLNHYGKFQFIVEDNGRGIPEESRQDLFRPFKRERNAAKGGAPGTGLGLSVVKNLVDLMEGSIAVESEAGKGSRFTVALMLRMPEELAGQDKGQAASDGVDTEEKGIPRAGDGELDHGPARELLAGEG